MGVKVVSVERRDTPTRYNLFHVRVAYDIGESDVPTDRMVFYSLFFSRKCKNAGCCGFFSPPPSSILLLSELLRVFPKGTDIGWIMTHFRKTNRYGFEIKSCHRWADISFAWRIFRVSRPT
jgi:hypothetical protein